MNALAFDGFEDVSISSWIHSAFSFAETTRNKKRATVTRWRNLGNKRSGLDIRNFINRGIRHSAKDTSPELTHPNVQTIGVSGLSFQPASAFSFTRGAISLPPAATRLTIPREVAVAEAFNLSGLISESARVALGENGIRRLVSFSELASGWDDGEGAALDVASLREFDRFFSRTGISPKGLGVFMSHEGMLIANWFDSQGELVELEFSGPTLSAFFESDGTTNVGRLEDGRFLEKIRSTAQ